MSPEEFAARRREEFVRVDDEIRASVVTALNRYLAGRTSWASTLVDDASVLWLEVFLAEAPNADPDGAYYRRFRAALRKALDKTTRPELAVEDVQVERITKWLGTYLVNNGTWSGTRARGGRFMRWTTMNDADVRDTHVLVDGQIKPVGGTFDVGGYDLHFPGEPVGPPEIWINCRCLLMPAAQRGEANMSPTTFAMDEALIEDEELPMDELEEGEEEVTEIPVHGVLAPEGVPTGDGRMFGVESLSNRELPLPIAYQLLSGEGHEGSATVGRIDEIFREGNEMRFRGALVTTKEHTGAVIEGIVDGTVRGISVDVDDIEVEMAMDDDGVGPVVFSRARIAGVTIVPIPAFQEAYIALGHEFAEELPEDEMTPEEALAACGCSAGVMAPEDEENPDIELGYDVYRDVSTEERKRDAEAGRAMPDGSYPIDNCEDLRNAIQAIGRAKDPEATKAHIRKRKSALGCNEVELPDTWAAELSGDTEQFAPGTKDGPGWITHPVPTARIRRYWVRGKGAAKIKWGVPGDFNRCRSQLAKYVQRPDWLAGLCANMHKEALGYWPSTHRKLVRGSLVAAGEPAPIFNLVASASTHRVFEHDAFERMEMEDPRVGLIVEGDRVYGYIAQWGVCHIGVSGLCTEAPPSQSGYWYYATGVVDTNAGQAKVGQITMDTGHASLRANAKVAAAHYDNTGAAVADISVGEDSFGIWFSGLLRPTITEDQRHALKASGRLSGDWRTIGGNLELVAALAVNVPGFPIPHTLAASADGVQTALVAAGIVLPPESQPAVTASGVTNATDIVGIIRASVAEYRHQEERSQKTAPIRAALRDKRVAAIRNKMKEK